MSFERTSLESDPKASLEKRKNASMFITVPVDANDAIQFVINLFAIIGGWRSPCVSPMKNLNIKVGLKMSCGDNYTCDFFLTYVECDVSGCYNQFAMGSVVVFEYDQWVL